METDKPRVLVVDDQIVVRQVLKVILQQANFIVVGEATNGERALDLCDQLRPDLICLDIFMPRKDGIEVLEQARMEYPETRVVMISGESKSAKVKEALALGAHGFIIKPFKPAQVLSTLREAMDR